MGQVNFGKDFDCGHVKIELCERSLVFNYNKTKRIEEVITILFNTDKKVLLTRTFSDFISDFVYTSKCEPWVHIKNLLIRHYNLNFSSDVYSLDFVNVNYVKGGAVWIFEINLNKRVW